MNEWVCTPKHCTTCSMVSDLQDLFRKCRKNVGYTCKYPALFVPLPSIYKQKTYVWEN